MKHNIAVLSFLTAAIFVAFYFGRLSVNETRIKKEITERIVQDTILDFQKSAFAAGFLKHTPISPGETPKWVWKTREEVWAEMDQEKISEFVGQQTATAAKPAEPAIKKLSK